MQLMARIAVAGIGLLWMGATPAADVLLARTPGAVFAIPDPQGLRALKNYGSPYFKSFAAMQDEVGTRLLAMLLPVGEGFKADTGGTPTPSEWAIAFSDIRLEQLSIPLAEFNKNRDLVIANVAKALGGPLPADAAGIEAATAAALQDIGAAKPNRTVPLGLYAQGDGYVVYGTLMLSEKTATTTVFARVAVKDRLMSLAWYRKVEGRADIDAAKASMVAWAREVVKKNQ